MDMTRQGLIESITRTGISQDDAELAVDQCTKAMVKHGIGAYAGLGLAAYFLNMTPATALAYAVATPVLGAGYGFFTSPQCQDVREAVTFWKTAEF